ncbi:hypothetical protein WJX74_009224 [Apatococcus lobatus]|uniref:Uncharacterized protein n=1 Tax=Apatococcus lobatus TaxID=904363 RepID=A0AAW1S732_9CHLO
MPPKSKTAKLTSFTLGSTTYKVNDDILVRGEAKGALSYVAKIMEIQQQSRGENKVRVTWFYRPEEATGGRKKFHGEKEVFKSDHADWIPISTIENKCHVHSLKNYQALKQVHENDFFFRFIYKPLTHEFRPDRVPVFCVCEMPYNPDAFMVACEKCDEWYHPKCLGLTKAQATQMDAFVCSYCRKTGDSNKRQKLSE